MSASATALSEDELAEILRHLASGGAGCGCHCDPMALMREDASIYQGRSTTETERLRAFVMVGIAETGEADQLIPHIIEELETGSSPYLLAAAARAARSALALPEEIAGLLADAIERIRHIDDYVHLDAYPSPPVAGNTSAIQEMIKTLATVGPSGRPVIKHLSRLAADGGYFSPRVVSLLETLSDASNEPIISRSCCGPSAQMTANEPQPVARSTIALNAIELQNQDGICTSFAQIFGGKSSVIAFFYTRCMNPDKCSRTISKLAQVHDLVQRSLPNSASMVAGITYDPEYDLPERLRRYGANRGMNFGDRCQLFRSTGPFDAIRDALQLGVGFGSSTVNRHRIELVIVDPAGYVVDFRVRRLWDEYHVAKALASVHQNASPDSVPVTLSALPLLNSA